MSMSPQDRQAIESVFERLKQVDTQGAPRDGEAEQFIQERLNQQPGAAYYMAQTILVQEQALQKAQERLQAQPQQAASAQGLGDGGFGRQGGVPGIGSRLSGGQAAQTPAAAGLSSGAGFGRSAGGGGFLSGALSTAMGVAGGMMLGSMLGGLFGGNDAQAGALPPEGDTAQDPGADAGQADDGGAYDDGGFDDGGGDFGGDF